jgi:hypothetical protein
MINSSRKASIPHECYAHQSGNILYQRDIPKEGTPRWNAEVYEPMSTSMIARRPENQTIGGASSYDDFRRSENVIDRRDEFLGRDQLAALKARGVGYIPGPEPAISPDNPLAAGLGLGNLPTFTGPAPNRMVRPGGIADYPAEGDTFNERFLQTCPYNDIAVLGFILSGAPLRYNSERSKTCRF